MMDRQTADAVVVDLHDASITEMYSDDAIVILADHVEACPGYGTHVTRVGCNGPFCIHCGERLGRGHIG